jgi:hypothetical protein
MLNVSKNVPPSPSTAHAPKSFCITVGLVPDYDALEGVKVDEEQKPSSTPPFAIPVGFANLVINGDETLNGKQKQIDLPLSSISDFLGMLDADVLEKGAFPLIELTSEPLESKSNTEEVGTKADASEKTKKRSIVKRIFARKQPQSSGAGEATSGSNASSVYSGAPRSIFQLDRPPNAKERALFLDQYSVDRDAIVRIGLEVFQRGSELEKLFRQKKKAKKSIQAASKVVVGEGSATSKGASSDERHRSKDGPTSSAASVGSRGLNMSDSVGPSLMDEDDDEEAMLDSDSDASSLSQSFFTLDSDSTWDDSTTYTDACSSFHTVGGDSLLSAISTEESNMEKGTTSKQSELSPGYFLSRFMNCHVPTNCGVDDDIDTDVSRVTPNIDAVTSAIVSMSFSEEDSRNAAWADHNSIVSKSSRPIHSDTSVDNAKQKTNANPPKCYQMRREDNASISSAKSKISRDRPPLSIEAAIPIESRMVTIQDEEFPLAVIIQRAPDFGGGDDEEGESDMPKQQQVDEGHEFTLEDHRSASVNSA